MTPETKPRTLEEIKDACDTPCACVVGDERFDQSDCVDCLGRLIDEAYALGLAARASPEEGRARKLLQGIHYLAYDCAPGAGDQACRAIRDRIESFLAEARSSPPAPPPEETATKRPPRLHETPPAHGFPGHDCATMPCGARDGCSPRRCALPCGHAGVHRDTDANEARFDALSRGEAPASSKEGGR